MSVVADCSVFLAWSLADEDEPVAIEAVRRVVNAGGVAPVNWWYELRNALLTNERRGRITAQQVAETLADCAALGIETDDRHDETLVLALAREHALSVYDAAYLEVASRRRLPLATLDQKLSEAAGVAGVPTIVAR
ncbi:MAG: type II toxin-antitoxin system VapC family toxin [Chloroflexi bacterium]|nr:type II toxin-antitoxin system VapC family toxin [Chloroflexota bacterium]MYD98796.1 type II toxin-antitoxin system VapC family toxin [Gammaproteobacteria bacterium]